MRRLTAATSKISQTCNSRHLGIMMLQVSQHSYDWFIDVHHISHEVGNFPEGVPQLCLLVYNPI